MANGAASRESQVHDDRPPFIRLHRGRHCRRRHGRHIPPLACNARSPELRGAVAEGRRRRGQPLEGYLTKVAIASRRRMLECRGGQTGRAAVGARRDRARAVGRGGRRARAALAVTRTVEYLSSRRRAPRGVARRAACHRARRAISPCARLIRATSVSGESSRLTGSGASAVSSLRMG